MFLHTRTAKDRMFVILRQRMKTGNFVQIIPPPMDVLRAVLLTSIYVQQKKVF